MGTGGLGDPGTVERRRSDATGNSCAVGVRGQESVGAVKSGVVADSWGVVVVPKDRGRR